LHGVQAYQRCLTPGSPTSCQAPPRNCSPNYLIRFNIFPPKFAYNYPAYAHNNQYESERSEFGVWPKIKPGASLPPLRTGYLSPFDTPPLPHFYRNPLERKGLSQKNPFRPVETKHLQHTPLYAHFGAKRMQPHPVRDNKHADG